VSLSPTFFIGFVYAISAISLLFALYLARKVLKSDTGTPEMREVSDAIKEGASAFVRKQYTTIGYLAIGAAILIFVLYQFGLKDSNAMKVTVAFVIGAAASSIAGIIGMYISVRSNIRTASAVRTSLNGGLQMALRGGAVSGITVVSMSLLGVGGLFAIYGGLASAGAAEATTVPLQIIGFGFGASFVALFAQLGGGIFTKAADVGADLIGKVESGLPEDDPRNPAVISDLVGDNVGDCAGRGADLFESISAENIGAMILGMALWPLFGLYGILFPLVARAFGLIATIVGVMVVKIKEDEDPMKGLNRGYFVTTVLAMIGFYVSVYFLLGNNLWFFMAGVVGLITALAFVFVTQYYTEYRYRPVRSIAEASKTGAATNIIMGYSVSMECVGIPVLLICAALMASYQCGVHALAAMPGLQIAAHNAGFYGTAVATMGMLAPCAYILAMDTFGPITDNAGGIIEMSGQPKEVRVRTDRLDSVGNTTKALTKGYAIGSAALSAFLLFRAYIDEVEKYMVKRGITGVIRVDLSDVATFVGALLGAALVFVFASLAIRAVGRAAYYVINEVRRQFKEFPGIMKGTQKPLYGRCVEIVTAGALKEMILPGLLAVLTPVAVGVLFRAFSPAGSLAAVQTVAAMLMVGTITGILVATMMNNGGGAWDNAKKFIETGQFGGKGSDTHKAAVVGDTVGDPLKDTAGPSIHVLIKLLSTVSLLAAPFFL
jgi:K(+)-stimulated pyrophosphate-energized sodium pump